MDFVFSTCLLCVAAAAVHCRCKSDALLVQRRCTVAAKALQYQCKGSALMLCWLFLIYPAVSLFYKLP